MIDNINSVELDESYFMIQFILLIINKSINMLKTFIITRKRNNFTL